MLNVDKDQKPFKGEEKQGTSPDDDGRVLADMSVLDDIGPTFSLPRLGKRKKAHPGGGPPLELSKEEKRAIALGVIKAHLAYALLGLVLLVLVYFLVLKLWLGF